MSRLISTTSASSTCQCAQALEIRLSLLRHRKRVMVAGDVTGIAGVHHAPCSCRRARGAGRAGGSAPPLSRAVCVSKSDWPGKRRPSQGEATRFSTGDIFIIGLCVVGGCAGDSCGPISPPSSSRLTSKMLRRLLALLVLAPRWERHSVALGGAPRCLWSEPGHYDAWVGR